METVEQRHERYQRLKAAGKCCVHTARDAQGAYCQECLDAQHAERERRASLGLCLFHDVPAEPGKRCCFDCNLARRIANLHLLVEEAERAEIAFRQFDGKCQCCGAETSGSKNDWCIDHNHFTHRFRGIICHRCNVMLGGARDKDEILDAGIQYLRRTT